MPEPDYDQLAKQHGGTAVDPATVDYDALARSVGGQAAPASFLDLAIAGVKGVVDGLNPLPLLTSLYDDASGEYTKSQEALKGGDLLGAVGHGLQATPVGQSTKLLGRVGGAQLDQFRHAKEWYDKGDIEKAVAYTVAGVTPLLGPFVTTAGEEIRAGRDTGDPRTQAHGLGMAASLLVPKVAGAVLPSKLRVPGTGKFQPSAAETAAVQYAERAGIPIDAATATGSPVVRGAQALADRSLGGSLIGHRAARAQSEALARTATALEGRAYPSATSPETAGTAVRGAVEQRITDLHGEASKAYGELRDLERQFARPVQVGTRDVTQTVEREVPPAEAPPVGTFTNRQATAGQLFAEAYDDAKANGYTGTLGALRKEFDAAVKDAKEIAAEDTGTPTRLLKDIAALGGLDEKFMSGEMDFIRGMRTKVGASDRSNMGRMRGGVIGGVRGVTRNGGKTFDTMAESLREHDPIYQHILGPNELFDAIAEANAALDTPRESTLATALEGIGVRPGNKWWDVDTSFDVPTIERTHVQTTEPVFRTMGMPIDLTEFRTEAKPLYDRLKRDAELAPLMGADARTLRSLDRLMDGPSIMPVSDVDRALGRLKGLARFKGMSELRGTGKGSAGYAVNLLEKQVREAVSHVGPGATYARTLGRQATREKYEVGDILKDLRQEPVKAYRQATMAADQNIDYLRKLQRIAPSQMPQVGRAYLTTLFEKATAEGGFGKAQTLQTEWQKLGPETKRTLFPDKALRDDLDHFFLVAKKISENPNPSGTALVGWLPGQAYLTLTNPLIGAKVLLGGAALSKLLHSRLGVRLLTEAIEFPVARNRATAGLKVSRVASLAGVRATPLVPARATDESAQK